MPEHFTPNKVKQDLLDSIDAGLSEKHPAMAAYNMITHLDKTLNETIHATQPDAPTQTGLYDKYIIIRTKDFETEKKFAFVLIPETDPAAQIALEIYIKYTEDKHLASDLEQMLDSLDEKYIHDESLLPKIEPPNYQAALEVLKKYLGKSAYKAGNGDGMAEHSSVDVLTSIHGDVADILKNPEEWIENYNSMYDE